MHNIMIIGGNGHQCIMNIGGIEIKLSKRNNGIDITNIEELSAVISEISYLFQNHKPVNDLPKKLCGVNILRIMDTFFYSDAFEYWKSEFACRFNGRKSEFSKIFYDCFGFTYVFHNKTPLSVKIRQFAFEYVRNPEIARSEYFEIEYLFQNNNIATFRINDKHFELCLVGRGQMRNPADVLNALTDIKKGLITKDELVLKKGISLLGPLASLSLQELFFKDATKEFFCDLAIGRVHETRALLQPRKLLKEYFGNARTGFYNELLNELESLIPEHNEYLNKSNIDVLYTNDDSWILYNSYADQIHRLCLVFSGTPKLIAEIQSFLRYKAKRYINSGKPFSQSLYRIWAELSIAINFIYDEQDNLLESILDLTVLDIQDLQAYLAQEADYGLNTQRGVFIYLKALYKFTLLQSKDLALAPLKTLKFPKFKSRSKSHTEPISQETLNALLTNLDKLPTYIRLAFLLCAVTAARANSICLLTTDSIQKSCGKCTVKVYYQKTYEYRIKKGKSPFVIHEIPEKLYDELFEYIQQTEELRSLLETPYILVYRSTNYRIDTMRLPNVLRYDSFTYEIGKILDKVQLYNDRGERVKCGFRNIRAEVGRAMFAMGKTEKEVAAKLGNSEVVARSNYNVVYPADEAELYNRQYKITVEQVKERIETMSSNNSGQIIHIQKELYGHCNAENVCSNKNDCLNCPQRIISENHAKKE